MRYPAIKPTQVQSKVVILTGGLRENISQLEMKPGMLINGHNYQEIDGVYHGYSSIPGVERFDGKTSPSDIDLVGLTDYGITTDVGLLLESIPSTTLADQSQYSQVVANGSIEDLVITGFQGSSFYFTGASEIGVTQDEELDLEDVDFTIEFRIKPKSIVGTQVVLQKANSYKVEIVSGAIKFSYSTDGATWTDSFTSAQALTTSTLQHVSIIRKGTDMYIAVGGEKDSISYSCGADTIFTNTNDLSIGASSFIGNLDEIRIVHDYIWIFDFTPPVVPYSTAGYYWHQWDDEAREAQRALIDEVPGEGSVDAVNIRNGAVTAIRNEAGGLSAAPWVATAAGWVSPGTGVKYMQYENGTDTDVAYPGFLVGETVTGSVSGATAEVQYISQTSGSWENIGSARDATGWIVLVNVVGGPFVDTDLLSNGVTATADVVDNSYESFTLEPDGDYHIINARFDLLSGHSRELLPFYVNGVNFPFWFDETEFIPIVHSELPDEDGVFASHIAEFKNRLWLAYPDGRLHYSAVGDPLNHAEVDGAGSIYMEDEITALQVIPGDALVVFCRNRIQVIKSIVDSNAPSGTQSAYAFFNETFSHRSGAINNTVARLLGDVYFMDDRGYTKMSNTDAFGDFSLNSVSKNVQNTLLEKKNNIVGVLINRESNQLRLYFDDKYAFVFTFDQEKKIKGVTELKMLHTPSVLEEGEDSDGNHIMFMGSTDGFVYQLDKGTSFDGEEIETKLETAFYHYGSPTNWKRFQKITLEAQADKGLIFLGNPVFNYRDSRIPRSSQEVYESAGAGGKWGQDAWSQFAYGGSVVQSPALYLNGYGNNMSMTIITSDKYASPHVLNSMIVEYSRHSRKM